MAHKKYLHRPTVIKDLTFIIAVNLLFLLGFSQVDVLEWAYLLSREHEDLELDELLPLGISISLSLLVFSYRRIKELGIMAQTLEEMSLLDLLSGLANRRAGQISLISWCELAQKNQQIFIVYHLNINNFSQVNKLYGQLIGDEVITEVGQRLSLEKTQSGQLFRWLDDHFIMVVPLNEINTPNDFAYKLQRSVNDKLMTSTLSLSCSIGYAIWQKGQEVDDILAEAEDALMHAKHRGNGGISGGL